MLIEKWKQATEKVRKIPEKFVEVDWRARNWKKWFVLQRKYFERLQMKTWAEKQGIWLQKTIKGLLEKKIVLLNAF
jgi:hypothetical protein